MKVTWLHQMLMGYWRIEVKAGAVVRFVQKKKRKRNDDCEKLKVNKTCVVNKDYFGIDLVIGTHHNNKYNTTLS